MKTDEVINWRSLIEHFEQDLKVGDSSYPATDAFKSDEGAKRWSDFKTRIVEHVKFFYEYCVYLKCICICVFISIHKNAHVLKRI